MHPSHRIAPFAVCIALVAGAPAMPAQAPTVVRLRVRDEGGAPVARAEVAVVRGVAEVVARGTTGEVGTVSLDAPLAGGEYHVVVRRRGFARAERFFTAGGRDTVALDVDATPAAPVAEPEAWWQRYVVDAEAIAASAPPVADTPEILSRLRPAMLQGRGDDRACRPVGDVQVLVQGHDGPVRAAPSGPGAAEWDGRRDALHVFKSIPPNGPAAVPPHVLAVLRSIRPEHVAEMRNAGCTPETAAPADGVGVLSVLLKPGIVYEAGVGSHAADAPDRSTTDRPLPAYRSRRLVVYDAINGEPVVGVEVTHVASGAKGLTDLAGTVALGFLPEGESSVRLTRPGYQPVELPLTISPADDRPITILLRRAK